MATKTLEAYQRMKLPISRETLEVPVEMKDLVFCPSSGIFSGNTMTLSAAKIGVFLAV